MSHLSVDPQALSDFAARCVEYGDEIDDLSTRLEEARVSSEAFGRIPWVASRINEAYSDHVDQCSDGAFQPRRASVRSD